MIWVGRQSNDIVRPDGVVAVKATGKDFECHVGMLMEVNEAGRITRINEYYNREWSDGIRQQQYTVMKGGSLKAQI
jgi:ketosteroid isomerase-like protein